jgi:eukaryotic-like serine/threonine-protein kinase
VIDSANDATLAGTSSHEPAMRSHTSAVEPGAVVGRHVVLQRIGAGGMGVVYAAYDPELDRKVALKLLLPGAGGDTGRVRLLREAQALARLSHPNVVGIHDVGTVGEQVWLAMEFVQGQTLGTWLAQQRGWREVLEILRRAGEGLAAAHAVGLLHRDFKPDNIMVGDDGRVCVMDFGLARVHANAMSLGIEQPQSSPEPNALATNVTRAGVVVGTPSYMAPEQFAGKDLTAAADQFAFCVTLWAALYGERPFAGREPQEIASNVIAGTRRSPPKGRAVPSWLRRVCERGLAVEPAQRWPSMEALLDTLAKGRQRAAVRKGLLAVGVLVLLGAGVQAHRDWDIAQRTSACDATGAEAESAWNAERGHKLHDALVATGVSFAPMTADKVTPWLEHQAMAWREARVEACLDADVRGQWDAETLDRSLWCLDARLMELESLVDELTLADAGVVYKGVAAAAGMAPVAACRDVELLGMLTPPPAADREALRAVRADVMRAGNLERAGRYGKGLELARGALVRAEALAWPPLVAEARLQLGVLLERSGAYPEAEAELERAYFEACKGVAPAVAFDAAIWLARTVGVSSARPVEGRRWARLADVVLADLHDGEHLRRGSLLASLANIHYASGDYDEARALHEQAVLLFEEALGPRHPDVATSLNNLASVHYVIGDYDAAKHLFERALAIREAALGREHPVLANTLNNLANVHYATDDNDEAKRLYERALAIWEPALGPQHPDVANSLNNLAAVHASTGDYGEAKRLLERALAIQEQALPPKHPSLATSLTNLANTHAKTGDHDEAARLFERALAIQEELRGPEHPDVADPLVGLAMAMLEQRRPVDALPLALRAVAIQQGNASARGLAAARGALARALWEVPVDGGRDRERAVALAEQARDAFRDAGIDSAKDLAEVEQWLDEHRAEP